MCARMFESGGEWVRQSAMCQSIQWKWKTESNAKVREKKREGTLTEPEQICCKTALEHKSEYNHPASGENQPLDSRVH